MYILRKLLLDYYLDYILQRKSAFSSLYLVVLLLQFNSVIGFMKFET